MSLDTAKIVQLIQTTLTRRGDGGSKEDPIRIVTQFWTFDGKLVAEVDPFLGRPETTIPKIPIRPFAQA